MNYRTALKRLRPWLKYILLAVIVGVGLPLLLNLYMLGVTAADIHASPDEAPACRVAVVLGARVHNNGRPSQILGERLFTALQLYQSGKVRKIIVSGNNQAVNNGESDVMREWLLERGVAPEDVQSDHAGFRTLDTCARMARVWNLDREEGIIFISQSFHLPRTIYLARKWGLNPIGISANGEGWNTRPGDHLRESLARVKAWLDVNILNTPPRHLGPPEHI